MRNKPSKKKTFFGFILGFFEHENIELIILGIASLVVSILGHAIYTNHAQIQTQFDVLATNVKDLSYVDEDLYDDCTNKLDTNEIVVDVNNLRAKLDTLIDQHSAMGSLTSVDTYCAIHQFTSWNDQLQDSGENVCKMPLKSETELEEWRNQILKQIYKNKASRQGAISSLKEYFTNFQNNTHTPNQCQ